jgi:S1-C subfamily serine protease
MSGMRTPSVVAVAVGLALALGVAALGDDPPTSPPTRTAPSTAKGVVPADDRTFRPTVVVRQGNGQGSGTVIASLDGDTLVLTAAHVVPDDHGKVTVELHRYNLGLERFSRIAGGWPRVLNAEIVATDRAADLAVVRVRGMKRLHYVVRLAPGNEEPARGTVVTSVGIDLGEHLSSWQAYVEGVEWIKLGNQKQDRPFMVTSRPPEHGRSGGGLFLPTGEQIGVCIGRVEVNQKPRIGIFASIASIRHLLRDHDLEETVVRSEALARAVAAARRASPSTPSGPVTPTRATPARPLARP